MRADTTAEVVDSVMERVLDGDHPYLVVLRDQYRGAEYSIQTTASGIFVDFEVPEDAETVPVGEDFHFGDVEVTMDGLSHGMGFVRNGKLSEVEGYTYEESLPETIDDVRVAHTEDRDLDDLFSDIDPA